MSYKIDPIMQYYGISLDSSTSNLWCLVSTRYLNFAYAPPSVFLHLILYYEVRPGTSTGSLRHLSRN